MFFLFNYLHSKSNCYAMSIMIAFPTFFWCIMDEVLQIKKELKIKDRSNYKIFVQREKESQTA